MDRSALVMMDYQNAICKGMVCGEVERRGVLARAARVLAAARAAAMPVIHVRVGFDAKHSLRTNRSARFAAFEAQGVMRLDTEGAAFCSEVEPLEGEPVVTKGCVNPFIGTPLTEVLVGRRADRLYLAGVATNMVVESALRHAGDSGYACTVIEDCCASYDEAMHAFAIERIFPMFGEVCSSLDFSASLTA